jgi:hypothetical protein
MFEMQKQVKSIENQYDANLPEEIDVFLSNT